MSNHKRAFSKSNRSELLDSFYWSCFHDYNHYYLPLLMLPLFCNYYVLYYYPISSHEIICNEI